MSPPKTIKTRWKTPLQQADTVALTLVNNFNSTLYKSSLCANLTHMSHLHLHYVHSCGCRFHYVNKRTEISQILCKPNCPVIFFLFLGQNEHLNGQLLFLGTQVAGTQLLHHYCPRSHHTLCSTGWNTISQLYLARLHSHLSDVECHLKTLLLYL